MATILRFMKLWFLYRRHGCGYPFLRLMGIVQERPDIFRGCQKFNYGLHDEALVEDEVNGRGEHVKFVSEESRTKPDMISVTWIERERRYFVYSPGTDNAAEPAISNTVRIQNGQARKIEISSVIPQVCANYYKVCFFIDRHYRCRQQDLNLDKILKTEKWATRLNTS